MWYVLFYNISSSLQKVPKAFLSPSLRGFFLVIARKGETLPKQSHSVVSSCSVVPPCLSLRGRTVVLPKQSLIEYSWKYHSIVTNYQRLLRTLRVLAMTGKSKHPLIMGILFIFSLTFVLHLEVLWLCFVLYFPNHIFYKFF